MAGVGWGRGGGVGAVNGCRKASDKKNTSICNKMLSKLAVEGNSLHIIRNMCENPWPTLCLWCKTNWVPLKLRHSVCISSWKQRKKDLVTELENRAKTFTGFLTVEHCAAHSTQCNEEGITRSKDGKGKKVKLPSFVRICHGPVYKRS